MSFLPHLAPLLLLFQRLLLLQSFLTSQPLLLFFTRAFFYPRSSHINGLHSLHNVVIVLVTGDRRMAAFPSSNSDIICGTFTGLHQWKHLMPTKIEPLHIGYEHAPCRLAIYRIICHSFPFQNAFQQRIGLRIGGSSPIEMDVTLADQAPRQLVVCPGRVFLFDQWHLLITSLELYRLHRIDLVLVHVHSVHPSLMALLRLYEEEGIVRVRPSLRMPSGDNSLAFDPNSETLWNNQLVNFHDCLYTFKESSDFIAFPDWDDLLITPASTPLPVELHNFVSVHPYSAALLPKRFPGQFPTIAQLSPDRWEMADMLIRAVRFSVWPSDAQFISKVLLRPKFVSGVDLHGPAGTIAWGHQSVELPVERAFFIHARDYQRNPRITQRLPSAPSLITNLATFLTRHNASLSKLPKTERFLSTLNECLGRIEAKVRSNRRSKCFNYAQCRLELMEKVAETSSDGLAWECVGADNRWSTPLNAGHFRFYVLEEEAMARFHGIRCLP